MIGFLRDVGIFASGLWYGFLFTVWSYDRIKKREKKIDVKQEK